MPVPLPFYHELCQKIADVTRQAKTVSPAIEYPIAVPVVTVGHSTVVRRTTVERLALLSVGIIAAKSCVLPKVADELLNLRLTKASQAESILRRLRRTLNDKSIDEQTCYEPVVKEVIDWESLRRTGQPVQLIIDESTKEDKIHLFRVSLAYRGSAVPLAGNIWEQNQKLPEGTYWRKVDEVLDRVATILPTGLFVFLDADRAFENPTFVDKIAARGWHWIVRLKANSDVRFRDRQKREYALKEIIRRKVCHPGQHWKGRGWVYKDAGWREASVIGIWARGQKEPLVIITDLATKYEMLEVYARRFWIEPSFRNDKKAGWRWEDSQVTDLVHQKRLMVAMAFASLVVMCQGAQEAEERVKRQGEVAAQRKAQRKGPAKPQHARQSIFTMGMRRASGCLYRTADRVLRWFLPDVGAASWNKQWYENQSHRFIFETVRLQC